MSKRAVLFLAAILLLTTGFQHPKDKPAKPAPTGSGAGLRMGAGPPTGWTVFAPKDGGFSVMLPGKPSKISLQTDTDKGPVTSPLYKLEQGDFKYVVGYLDHPVSVEGTRRDEWLEKAAEQGITEAGGKVVSNKPISLRGNYPGREVKGEARGFLYHSRVYLVKQRVYILILWILSKKPEVSSETATRFFDSFAVLPAQAAPAVSTP